VIAIIDPVLVLAQQGPPEEPQSLPAALIGLIKQWVGVGMAMVFIFGVICLALMFTEISRAKDEGRAPAQIVDRLLVVAGCVVAASAVGSIAAFIWLPLP
jgi:hypothetical protein